MIALIKTMIFWITFYLLYKVCSYYEVAFAFNFVVATLFIAVVLRTINTERYNNLVLKEGILKSAYDLICTLRVTPMGGMSPYFASEYPIIKKAMENTHLFYDPKIVVLIYMLEEAVSTKNHNLIQGLDHEYLLKHLYNLYVKRNVANFLINEIIIPIFFEIPNQIIDLTIDRINNMFKSHDEKKVTRDMVVD